MRASGEMAKRMRDMLTQDKVGIKDGFAAAMENDVNDVLGDYFDLKDRAKIKIGQNENGEYTICIEAVAIRIKHFDTTLDVKRY